MSIEEPNFMHMQPEIIIAKKDGLLKPCKKPLRLLSVLIHSCRQNPEQCDWLKYPGSGTWSIIDKAVPRLRLNQDIGYSYRSSLEVD